MSRWDDLRTRLTVRQSDRPYVPVRGTTTGRGRTRGVPATSDTTQEQGRCVEVGGDHVSASRRREPSGPRVSEYSTRSWSTSRRTRHRDYSLLLDGGRGPGCGSPPRPTLVSSSVTGRARIQGFRTPVHTPGSWDSPGGTSTRSDR